MTLFDTDMVTLLQRGHAKVLERYRSVSVELSVTIITRIEVFQGRFASILKAADQAELLRAVQSLEASTQFLDPFPTVTIDEAAAQKFEELLAMKKLKKIGRADLLIASVALANGATLVSRNRRDFERVPSLQLENWAD